MDPSLWKEAKARLIEAAASLPPKARITGTGTKAAWTRPMEGEAWRLPAMEEPLVFFSPDDQVAAAWGSARVADVLAEVEGRGLTLPIPRTGHPLLDGVPGTMGGWCAMNFPHALWGRCMAPRESVLGMGIILGDGTAARCGAGVVKSVAGYDIHRFFCGSRGMLGAIGLVILRLTPLKALPSPQARAVSEWKGEDVWIQRVLRSRFAEAERRARGLLASDPDGCLLWQAEPPRRWEDDWVIGPGGLVDPAPPEAAARARESFDPQGRWT